MKTAVGVWGPHSTRKYYLGNYNETVKSLIGYRMELTGYFIPREERREIVGPEVEENGSLCHTYWPNGDYYFNIQSYTLPD